eukprot:CAMPEP_0197632872 /NCGR_PEP_ID=MMETSP1338-20131121/9410_1 /TAXON_ID=43686 ORGANISM="Pelagodinium beii, Strain RCC1491" /NCGR_SAMPLE_ID=MMETSP1338 /ASSEMBLY_ACC=CAM_ASM_000754 /LENGTH=273 /DNA_ID=CAMNT_0043204445 /DNA_START=37 /DNA_END=855 /DNA_ORIENTATION=+
MELGEEIPSHEIEMEEKIGTGMTAEVFKGRWRGQVVAIKQINSSIAATLAGSQAPERELKVMCRVDHENLVRLYGMCTDPLRIITEFCAGGACFEFLHNSDIDLSFKQSTKMCLDVARAMRYLHTFTPMIVHRDLKSLNLLLDQNITGPADLPLVKVCDFGVSKFKSDDQWGKQTVQAGTKHWMAPEMWHGSNYTEKVDVFSYAMVVYEVLCREIPFEEEEPGEVGKFTLAGVRPDLDAVPVEFGDTVPVQVMQRCWQQEPDERPPFTDIVPW